MVTVNGRQTGLVVDPSGKILTVLELPQANQTVTVDIPGRGKFQARVVRTDPRTDVALLSVDANGLTPAPLSPTSLKPGEPVQVLSRDTRGALKVTDLQATSTRNAPDFFFTVFAPSGRSFVWLPVSLPNGSVVVGPEGDVLGLANDVWPWPGPFDYSLGRPPPSEAAVLLRSAAPLLNGPVSDSAITPVGLLFVNRWSFSGLVHDPTGRQELAQPLHTFLQSVGSSDQIAHLGEHLGYVVPPAASDHLELLFQNPQTMRMSDGRVVGRARLVVFWWNRGGGKPDLILCGADTTHLGAAFAWDGANTLENALQDLLPKGALPPSPDATPTPTPTAIPTVAPRAR